MTTGETNAPDSAPQHSRRHFIKRAAITTAALAGMPGETLPGLAADNAGKIALLMDPGEPLLKEAPVKWAMETLRTALQARGFDVQLLPAVGDVPANAFAILASGGNSTLTRGICENAKVNFPKVPEALALVRGKTGSRSVLLAAGSDARGLAYALLEMADRVQFAADPVAELKKVDRVVQQPANQIRSIARLFASDVEDKGWFNDKSFWQAYLTELATQRFNRFSLMLGLGYDFTTDIRDAYLHFAYPFLVSLPDYNVRAKPLPDDERDRNLAMLQFISEETARRGLHFQLGLWTHAYQWVDSPRANYVIEGLSKETHAPYCRDALAALLRDCPAIQGVTFRIHGESGVAEGSYDFWKTVFDGVVRCGRRLEIDMHAKGMEDPMIELALATGMPVNISPKFWAEHMGLGYMQGAIRPLEMPPRDETDRGFFARSSGSRRFLRYGYGDLLREDRRYGILHRVWPGTQRLLLWGSPELAADYSRASSFCGSAGVEWCEPLSFKGRKGSGLPGGRDAYADASLRRAEGDFAKYRYSYRVWGRHMYDPECARDEWQRYLGHHFGKDAPAVDKGLGAASGILPLFTTAHCPSAANNNYWPEMYTDMAIVDAKRPHPYSDTLTPKRFGAVSSLDPEFFSRVDDFAEGLLQGDPGAKYSPAWVAASLEAAALAAQQEMGKLHRSPDPELRRVLVDVAIQSGLGHFFAGKLRAATLYAIYARSGRAEALEAALAAYRAARETWAKMAQEAKSIYRDDVTFGPGNYQRGHWANRLPAMDADIADMEKLMQRPAGDAPNRVEVETVKKAIAAILSATPERKVPALSHEPSRSFRRGEPLPIEVSFTSGQNPKVTSIRLRYRRVNQSEIWQVAEMQPQPKRQSALIPADYTASPFPLQYHFEIRASGESGFYPGLKPGWHGQPYFVVRQA